jgi:hypothetical protein
MKMSEILIQVCEIAGKNKDIHPDFLLIRSLLEPITTRAQFREFYANFEGPIHPIQTHPLYKR